MPQSNRSDLTPTGDCYKAAAYYLIDAHFSGRTRVDKLRLVHGILTLTRPPYLRFGHAWVEINDAVVYDAERDLAVPIVVFYAIGQIIPEECYIYDFEALRQKINEYGHYGPWEGPEGCPPVDKEEDDECEEAGGENNEGVGGRYPDDDVQTEEEGGGDSHH